LISFSDRCFQFLDPLTDSAPQSWRAVFFFQIDQLSGKPPFQICNIGRNLFGQSGCRSGSARIVERRDG